MARQGWSEADKKLYAERMRLGRERARAQRAAAPLPSHVVVDDIRRTSAVPLDPSRWVRSGRSHLISRIDPETGEVLAQGWFENRTARVAPMAVPPDAKGAWFDRAPRDVLIIAWVPA